MALYLVTQSVFFLGAVIFRRFAFGKTIASLALLGIAFAVIAGVVLRIVFYDQFKGMTWTVSEDEFSLPGNVELFFRNYAHLLENLFWYALAPLLWVVVYFKLKETEA
jgi:ABC-type proline/glycine betaine transport system permease subunit